MGDNIKTDLNFHNMNQTEMLQDWTKLKALVL